MSLCKLFPRALAAFFALSLSALTAGAQTNATNTTTRPRQTAAAPQQTVTTTDPAGRTRLESDLLSVPHVVSEAEEEEEASALAEFARPANLGQFERVMLTAIEGRLGVPYRLGAEGPYRYDCSGFVWSVFQAAGIDFERGSARTFWSRFEPAGDDDKFKFGTLVFFNNLRHVGIVADVGGFYHASSSKGVVYSRFGEYWTKRITGFRRVPLAQARTLIAAAGK